MQHKYTHAAIIAKYEAGLSIIRFDYNRVAMHLLVCVFMVLIPLRFDYNRYSTNSSVSIIIFQFHKGSIITIVTQNVWIVTNIYFNSTKVQL